MSEGIKSIIYPVKDLEKAKKLFGALLGEPNMDQPYYVNYDVGGIQVGLNPHGQDHGSPVTYFLTGDIHATLKTLLDAGASTAQDVSNVGGGAVIASVKDADGNIIGLIQG